MLDEGMTLQIWLVMEWRLGLSADVDNNREKVILWIIQIWYRKKLDMLEPKRTEIIVTRFDEDWKKYFKSILVLEGVF